MTRLGQAGLKGWREKVANRVAGIIARRTPLEEDQAHAVIGGLFFGPSVVYVAKTVATLSRELRSS